jgi:hypothetical protein
MNRFFMFSTINIRGAQSTLKAIERNKSDYARKVVSMVIIPKLILIAMAAGLWGLTKKQREWWKDTVDDIPENRKSQRLVIPVGRDKNDKPVYFAFPQDYDAQVFGSILWASKQGKFFGKNSVTSALYNTIPYSLNAVLEAVMPWIMYYMSDVNWPDRYRGRDVMDPYTHQAGGLDAAGELGKYSYKTMGFNSIYKLDAPGIIVERGALETALKYPILNALPGAFLEVSDGGARDTLYSELDEVASRKAREVLGKRSQKPDVRAEDKMFDRAKRGSLEAAIVYYKSAPESEKSRYRGLVNRKMAEAKLTFYERSEMRRKIQEAAE